MNHPLQAVQKFSELFQLLPCREAEKPSNQPKNRKPGILPGTAGLGSSLLHDPAPESSEGEDAIASTADSLPSTMTEKWD